MDLSAIQQALRDRNIDAWLFYDHHHRDPIAYRVLGLPDGLMVTRRWYYLIPAKGEPVKLLHKIESGHLDTLPGTKKQYAGWQELFDGLKQMLAPHRNVAMQYSPNNFVFTISMVDAGTADMIRGLGKNIVSAADLIALFEATLTDEQIKSHFAARDVIDAVTAEAFKEIGRRCSPEIALLPIGAYYPDTFRNVHMNPAEAMTVFRDLGAQWLVPMHFGTFKLSFEEMDEPPRWLKEIAHRDGLSHHLQVLEEGVPHVF